MVYCVMCVKNKKEITLNCIKSLQKQDYPEIKIVVVDDGSTDGLTEVLQKDYSEIEVLKGNGNLWFTKSMNLGIEHSLKTASNNDFILFLNNDTQFDSNYVSELVKASNENGLIPIGTTCKSLNTKELMYNTHHFNKGLMGPRKIDMDNDVSVNLETQCLNTRGTIVPVKIVKEVGLLSTIFPQYSSDYDYFFRVKKAGYRLGVSTKAITYSVDDGLGLADKIIAKSRISLKEYWQLFFSRRSFMNLWSRPLSVLLHTTPFSQKLLGLSRIYLYTIYTFFKKVRSFN